MKKTFILAFFMAFCSMVFGQNWGNVNMAFPENMTVTSKVFIDGTELNGTNYVLGAFCGDELRGSAKLQYFAPEDDYLAMVLVYGNGVTGEHPADQIKFKLYDLNTDKVYSISNDEALPLVNDKMNGSLTPYAPYEINFLGNPAARISETYYATLQEAVGKAENGETVTLLTSISLAETIKITKNIVLDLNGKTITGTDNSTASFALIEVQPDKELTVKGNGVITLTSVNNRGWNAYSSVISNQRGKLVVDGATIEHIGGTDMAYAIDNLTNTGAQIAETVINAGTIKSPYRAIRQFLNSSAQGVNNILTVNGGTIEGANKSIWMQDANAKANPGKLTVSENASLKGDVYLTVTAGSTEWPVEVMVKAAALKDGANVLPNNNVPAKYEVKLVDDYYTVVEIDPVAKIGETLYYSLQAAFAAAEDNQTVVMLRNVTEDFAISNTAKVTFDMDGNTLNGAILPSTANLTINGGTITNIDKSHSAIEINAGSLVLNDVNVSSARHAVRIDGNGVDVTINGGTYSVKVSEGASMNTRYALYVGGNNASDKAVVTVIDGEFIGPKGSTSDSGAAVNVKAGSEVYVKGGKFSGGKIKTLSAKGTLSLTGGIYDQDVQEYCAENYEAKNQGDGTYLVRRKPAGHVAYRADVTDKEDREGIAILLKEVYAFESLVVKVYNNETLMFTCTRREIDDEDKVMFPVEGKNTTANIVLWGKVSGSWINEIHVKPTELNVPNKIEVWSDGVLVDSYTHESGTVLGTNLEKYLALDCVKKVIAKVGETKYTSLKDAINACTNGETVKIIRDVTYTSEDVVNAIGGATGFGQYPNPCIVDIGGQEGENGAANIPSSVNAIIDLNGHTLTNKAEAYFFIIMDNAKVVFTDSSADKTGKVITNVDAPAVWVVGTETLVTIEDGYFQTASALGVLHSTHGGDLVIAGGEFKTTAERTNLLIMLNSKDRQNSANFIKGAATVSIKGGIFHGFNPSMVGDDNGATSIENIRFVNGCADGYAPIMINENTYTVIPAVAKIGEKYYATLAEAVDAATEGQTVTLLQNVELENTLTIAAGKVVTLDLNGNVVSGVSATAGTTAVITNKGNLTVMTSVEGGKITSQALTPDTNWGGEGEPSFPSYANNTVRNEGTFTLVSGTIENTSAAGGATYAIDNYNGSTTNINGGLVYCQNNIAIRLFCGDNIALNVNGGEVKGTRALWIQLASSNASVAPNVDVNITDGTLTATGNGEYKLAIYSYSYGNNMQNVEINISGGTFNGDIALTGGSNKENVEKLNITGGTFNGKGGDVYSYGDDAKAIDAITIKGGTFTTNTAEKYAEDNGYVFVPVDGKYVATEGAYVAKIDETRYTSLDKAITAATAGQTIEFIADITEDVTINKNITIDGANKNYTGKITVNKINVAFENINFVKGSIYKHKSTGVGGNYTINNCTFDGQGLNDYAVNLGGTYAITIEGVTAKNYGYGFLQVPASNVSLSVKNVTIDNVNYGLKVDYSNGVTIESVVMTNVEYYGIYDSNYGTKTYSIKNSAISSIGIWERNQTNYTTFQFEGENTVGTLSANQYAKYVLTAIDATLTAPEGFVVTTPVAGYTVKHVDGVYKLVANMVVNTNTNETYPSLAEAIANATAGNKLQFLTDINENVTINKSLTIDGANFNYTGTMSANNNITVTVQYVNFVNAGFDKPTKSTNGNYNFNYCTFDGQGTYAYSITAKGANKININNCTVKDYVYGFLYVKNAVNTGVNVKDVLVENCPNYAVYFGSGAGASTVLENMTVKNSNAGVIYHNQTSARTFTMKNCTMEGVDVAVDGTGGTNTITCKLEGDQNNFGGATLGQTAKVTLVNKDVTLASTTENLNVVSGDDDYIVAYEGGIYKLVPGSVWNKTQNKKYGTLQAAIDAAVDGDEIVLLDDINLNNTKLGLLDNAYSTYFKVEGKTITIDLNGMTISGTFSATPMLVGMFSTENNGHLTLVDNSTEKDALVELTSGNGQVYALIANYEDGSSITINGGKYILDKAMDSHMYTGGDEGIIVNGGNFHLGNVGTGDNGKPWIFNALGGNANNVVVNGGTFNADINHQFWANEVYVPETLALQNNGDGTWKVVNAVAYAEEKATSTGSSVRKVGYATLAEAVKAKGTTVTVTAAHVTTTTAVVEKDMTIDFAGYAITGDIYPVVRIQNNANLTVKKGNITNGDYIFTLGSSDQTTAGYLTIEGGNYVGETTVANVVKGLLTINGGEFSISEDTEYNYAYVINCYDANYNNGTAKVSISGGTFYNFNPEDNKAEQGGHTNFCAAGYGAVETATNIWTVVPKQGQTLTAGWNWFSSYININGAEGLATLENALGQNGVMIKRNGGYVEFYNSDNDAYDMWIGTNFDAVSVKEMYMINTNADTHIQLRGDIVDYANTEITINQGWNWIGYPVTEAVNINVALKQVQAKMGDKIVGRNATMEYIEGAGWYAGNLNSLEPGQGYMYYRASGESFEFTYNVPATREEVKANITADNNYWVPNSAEFANIMTMTAVLNIDGNEMKEDFEVAAFANGEVRGSARPIYIEAIDRYMVFMNIYGEGNEELTFKCYDIYSDEEYTLSNNLVYSDFAMIGSASEPYMLTLNTMGIGENAANTISLYPNPTTINTAISFETTCDMVEVFNALGVKVAEYRNVETIDGIEEAGVYVIRVTNDNAVQNCRLIVK